MARAGGKAAARICLRCGAGAGPAWSASCCCSPCSIPACGEDHGQERNGLVGGGQPGRVGLRHSRVVPDAVMFILLFIIIILFLNKYASKSLAGSWNCNQYGCVQPMSVFSKSAHATAAKEAVFSWDSDLAASNKRSGEEKFLQDLFFP